MLWTFPILLRLRPFVCTLIHTSAGFCLCTCRMTVRHKTHMAVWLDGPFPLGSCTCTCLPQGWVREVPDSSWADAAIHTLLTLNQELCPLFLAWVPCALAVHIRREVGCQSICCLWLLPLRRLSEASQIHMNRSFSSSSVRASWLTVALRRQCHMKEITHSCSQAMEHFPRTCGWKLSGLIPHFANCGKEASVVWISEPVVWSGSAALHQLLPGLLHACLCLPLWG